jgi:hypothetical protein
MVPTSLVLILLGFQCLGSPFHHFMVIHLLNHMLFQLVELCMGQLELFLKSLSQEFEVLVLGAAMLVHLLEVISHTSKALSKALGTLDLSIFLPWRIQIASHLWVVHYLSLDIIM